MRAANHATRRLPSASVPGGFCHHCQAVFAHRSYRPTRTIASVCCTQTAHTSLRFFATEKLAVVSPDSCHPLIAIMLVVVLLLYPPSRH